MKQRLMAKQVRRLAMAVGLLLVTSSGIVPGAEASQGTTQVSGVAREGFERCAPGAPGRGDAAFILYLEGDLEGCWWMYPEEYRVHEGGGTYQESGTEVFSGTVFGEPGSFETTYFFRAKFEDVTDPLTEIRGFCQHPMTIGTGTGVFDGSSGRVRFVDVVENWTFPYKGHFRL